MKCMKVLVHQQPYKEILWSLDLEKLFSLRWSSSSWFLLGMIVFVIATLEIVLSNHTWNMIISFKPCFVIIKIKINQTLVSQHWFVPSWCMSCWLVFNQLVYLDFGPQTRVINKIYKPISPCTKIVLASIA